VSFVPSDGERSPADQDPPFEYSALKTGPREYKMDFVASQDAMAWETQGPITDRTKEHLGAGDEGVILLRKILKEQIEIVQKGGEPMGLVRSAGENRLIDFGVINERIGLFRSETASEEKRAS
jgi:5,5'-dehydrodivanillate O-demethylase